MRFPSTRTAIIVALVLTTLSVPAVAWARTSPKTTVDVPAEAAEVRGNLDISGTASHRVGVAGVRLVVRNLDDGMYFNGDTWQSEFIRFDVPVHRPGKSKTGWSYTVPADKLTSGNYRARAFAYSVEGNGDGFGGDLNEFTYDDGFDPALYDTELTAPADGEVLPAGEILVAGIARSSEGVASVRVVVRSRDTGLYWSAERSEWQASFATVGPVLALNDDRTEATFAVTVPAEHVEPGTYFARAWVRTEAGNGDPIGRGQTTFTVDGDVEPPPPTTSTSTTVDSTTTTAKPTTTTSGPTGRRPYAQGNVDWELVASDNFNGSTLDDDMWEYGWWRLSDGNKYDRPVNNNETACYHTDQVTLSGGELSLSMRPTTAAEDASGVCQKKDGSPAYFVSGYATTRNRFKIQPGSYIETRMYMPGEGDVLYNWPAFWTSDIDKASGSRWPHSGEFDVAEVLQGKPCGNYHYATEQGGTHQQIGKRCSTVSANRWVVVGMKWNYDGTVEFYHDGKQVQDRGDAGDWLLDTVDLAGDFALNYSHNISLQHGMHDSSRTGYKEPTAENPLVVKFDYVDVYKL